MPVRSATQMMQTVHRLADEIGPRMAGSPANHAAADYIASFFQSAGLAVETQDYACTAWEDNGARLLCAGETLPVTTNAFSPACSAQAVLVPLCSLGELETADLAGRIGLLYGDLTRAPLSAKSWFLKSERDERIIALLERKQPAALLTVETATDYFGQAIEDAEVDIPSATISPAVAQRLLAASGATVQLDIRSRRALGTAANIVGRLAGRRAERIALMAHYDTKVNTPGASDNAGGVAALLGAAAYFSSRSLDCSLEFIAFDNEEYLPIGDDEYVRRAGDTFGEIIAAINFDGVGHRLATTSAAAIGGNAEFEALAAQAAQQYPGVTLVEPWPESNHSTFSFRGVPSVALSGVGMRGVAHHPGDTVQGISAARLQEAASLAATIVEEIQGKSAGWGRL